MNMQAEPDQVSFVRGRTRLFGIVGDPIAQVRSPEMVTHEMQGRGLDAVLVPLHVRAGDFDALVPALMSLANLDGLIFTIPFKTRALALADHLGVQARAIGAINALARRANGLWVGEMFDGMGCVQALHTQGVPLAGRHLMLVGLGGAGMAIAGALAAEHPARLRMFDLDPARCERARQLIAGISPHCQVEIGPPDLDGVDVLLNATPVGMLGDARLPLAVDHLPPRLAVFDAIVMPETTPLLALAQASGCQVVRGRQMMRGQIARIVDFFEGRLRVDGEAP